MTAPTFPALSPRELQCIAAAAEGCSNKEVGARLGLAEATVRSHLRRAGVKLGAGDRAHLVAVLLRAGRIGFSCDGRVVVSGEPAGPASGMFWLFDRPISPEVAQHLVWEAVA